MSSGSSNVLEVNAYYPFGMLMPGLSLLAPPGKYNAYKHTAREIQKELSLKWYDHGARMLDYTFGRWIVPDRYAEKYYHLSPYCYAANNPMFYTDPTGDTIILSQAFRDDKQLMKSHDEWATSKAGKQFYKDYGAGGKYGKVSVVFDVMDSKNDGVVGRTEVYGVNEKTGKETELFPSRQIDAWKERGRDVSNYRSKQSDNEYFMAKILMPGGVIDAYNVKQGGTILHETQHVRLMYGNILDYGYIFHSGADQHWYMKQEGLRWFNERYQYWQEKRPNYTRKEIIPLMNEFSWR